MKSVWLVAVLALGTINPAGAAEFSFSMPSRLTLARHSAENVAIGDANGDGRKDLAVTSTLPSFDHQVALFLQRADGSFAAPMALLLTNSANETSPVAFVDLVRGGAEEIVVGSPYGGMTIVRVTSTGVLSATNYPARRSCRFLAVGDLDMDGNMDIVCHDERSTMTLFYGDGAGGISSTTVLAGSAGAYDMSDFKSVQIADVTGDGLPDLLVTASSVNSFFVHPNNGFGGFWPATVYAHPWSATGVWPAALQALDLDGDGANEVVTASPDIQPDGALNVYRRGPDGFLFLSSRIPVYGSTTALIKGDVDGDGQVDLVTGHYGFNAVTYLRSSAAGLASQVRYDLPGFGNSIELYRLSGHSNGIALGDLDGDGCTDLAGATYSGVFVLHGCRPFVSRLPVSDFDGDGVSDLLWRNVFTGENYLWQWADLSAYQGCAWPCPLPMNTLWVVEATGDFDGDGNSEVFWRNSASGENAVQTLIAYAKAITGVTNPDWHVVGTGDFDGDDRADLLWRNARTGANSIWKSANSATPQAIPGLGDVRWKVAGVGDFDGDGRSDILWRHSTSGVNVVWRQGNPSLSQAVAAVSNPAWRVAGVGDFNGDGTDDIVWHNPNSGASAIWLSANGATQQSVTQVTNPAWDIAAVGDYNGDGRSDLLWRNASSGANAIWLSADARRQQPVAAFDTSLKLVR